jgi:hypothetical protein
MGLEVDHTTMRTPSNPVPNLPILRHLAPHLNHNPRRIAPKKCVRSPYE